MQNIYLKNILFLKAVSANATISTPPDLNLLQKRFYLPKVATLTLYIDRKAAVYKYRKFYQIYLI